MKCMLFIFGTVFSLNVTAADVTINTIAMLHNESCIINNGSDMFVDFGILRKHSFEVPNQVPKDVLPQMVTMPLICEGLVADVSLHLRLNGTPSTNNSNTIVTSNPDLGIAVSANNDFSDSNTWILPNTGTLPVKLTGNKADIIFYAAPVRTGNLPVEGPFAGVVTLSVEYP